MNEKYYLVNGYMPCICTCHKDCLRKDLIHRGYTVFSMERISKKQFDKEVAKMQRNAKKIHQEIEMQVTML
jgi:hypothetical protein